MILSKTSNKCICYRLCAYPKLPVTSSLLQRCLHVSSIQTKVLEQVLEDVQAGVIT